MAGNSTVTTFMDVAIKVEEPFNFCRGIERTFLLICIT